MKTPHLIAGIGALAMSATAFANHASEATAEAVVKSVEPISKTITTRTPYEECWEEEVSVVDRRYGRPGGGHSGGHHGGHYRSKTPSLLGAIIGGAIGNSLGHHSSNQKVGAVVGAMLGSSIARDIQHDSHHHNKPVTVRKTTEEVCEVHYREATQERVVGYRVAYEYGGNIYHTTLDEEPGDTIPVWVDVQPAL